MPRAWVSLWNWESSTDLKVWQSFPEIHKRLSTRCTDELSGCFPGISYDSGLEPRDVDEAGRTGRWVLPQLLSLLVTVFQPAISRFLVGRAHCSLENVTCPTVCHFRREVRCCRMNPARFSEKAADRPNAVRSEAIEFARLGCVDNPVTSFEQCRQMLWKGVPLLMMLSVAIEAAMGFKSA